MQIYKDFLKKIMQEGTDRTDRTGVGTRSIFGHEMHFSLDTFPLLTTKKVHFKSIVVELLWFLKGSTNTAWLHEHNVSIWDEWASPEGDLGPVYGYQWRSWPENGGKTIDQIALLIEGLRNNPSSRRHIVSAWNVGMLSEMALPPCHMMFQCYSMNKQLSLKITQRSADAFLGVPFNIASYALLCHLLAHITGHTAHALIWSGGDCHIYHNHFDAVNTQLARAPGTLPTLELNPNITSIDDFTLEDITLTHYHPQGRISAPIAV